MSDRSASSARRDTVLAAVAARSPVDARERMSIERFLTEIARLDEPFSEHADPTHVTASALVVGPRGVVLHRHRILGIWIQPGGHIDPGETPWDAAVRETAEETGLAVTHPGGAPTLAHVDVHPGPRGHTHLDLRYLLDGGDADPQPPPGESQDVAWFSWDEALAIAEPSMQGILRALAAAAPR
jgi:8-oxo-dGTP pyrophosphatase MutT (NUDIX family)